jgi:hypothetical protein
MLMLLDTGRIVWVTNKVWSYKEIIVGLVLLPHQLLLWWLLLRLLL